MTKVGKSPYPEWTYSLGAAFNYRGFDFSFLLQGIAGASFNLLDNAVQTRPSLTTAMFTPSPAVPGPTIPNKG